VTFFGGRLCEVFGVEGTWRLGSSAVDMMFAGELEGAQSAS